MKLFLFVLWLLAMTYCTSLKAQQADLVKKGNVFNAGKDDDKKICQFFDSMI